MSTLAALYRAVVASPEDRTVRLVYADALDETGDPADADRAEFVRTQIELEGLADGEAWRGRSPDLGKARCRDLFDRHWLDWWRPVCGPAGLPEPHSPGRRVRDRVARTIGRRPRRPANWPYTHTARNTSVQLAEYGVSVRFAGGFPEDVRFLNLDAPEDGPELVHAWGDAIPLVRLGFASYLTPAEWARVDGPHLARLPELTFERLAPETTAAVTASPHLTGVTRLSVNAVGANVDAVRALVGGAAWAGLRALHFTGRLSPDAVRDLAVQCRLPRLEELDLTLGNPADPGGQIGQLLSGLIRMFTQALTFPAPVAVRWQEYGPALEALAAAPWVRTLRRLRIAAGTPGALFAAIDPRPPGSAFAPGADLLPDAAVRALADAAETAGMERLELPGLIVSAPAREGLIARLGGRVAFG